MEPRLPLSVSPGKLEAFTRFWQSVSETCQRARNDLLESAALNQAAIKYSGYDLPFHAFLISLLIDSIRIWRGCGGWWRRRTRRDACVGEVQEVDLFSTKPTKLSVHQTPLVINVT
jgi:hypothetical protein